MNTITHYPLIHCLAPVLQAPPHPITVNVIGAGGTGSHLVTLLADTTYVLNQLGHPGFHVRVFDADQITQPNIGKQRFSTAEIGMNKAEAVVTRINRYFGFGWEAEDRRFDEKLFEHDSGQCHELYAQVTISCVDEVGPRHGIARVLRASQKRHIHPTRKPLYWIDCGNTNHTGQALLCTVGKVKQPKMKQVRTVSAVPFVTKEFGHLMVDVPDTPSCSTWEALQKQDLFINRAVALSAVRMLRELVVNLQIAYRGSVINQKTGFEVPVPFGDPDAVAPEAPRPRRKTRSGQHA
ncbi:PRTRC system ThiF family protein [Chitinophaga barathri]|uniref:PRTRC system ThiF family protein n=1 Tax=Chitinophaga barathri TaxID=1647451 RepID=A0A3N4MGS9_9BACT|nr:PRTRC system ThiF family protein [Chitinophaga barathri]RPD43071.1 PRTRC system ThiF family protein [Chitinophaga barathri]